MWYINLSSITSFYRMWSFQRKRELYFYFRTSTFQCSKKLLWVPKEPPSSLWLSHLRSEHHEKVQTHPLDHCWSVHFLCFFWLPFSSRVALARGLVKGVPLWWESGRKLCYKARADSLFWKDWYPPLLQWKLIAPWAQCT